MTSYWKSVMSVFTGTAIAQIISFVGSLIVARKFSPDQFGTFSVWLSVVTLVSVFLTGRFEITFAIKESGEPRKLALISTIFTTFVGSIILLIAFLLILLCFHELHFVFSPILMILIIPAAFAAALMQVCQSWATAEGQYSYLSYMRILQGVSVTVGQVLASFFSPTSYSLALAFIAGVIISYLPFLYIKPPGVFFDKTNVKLILGFWRDNHKFPFLSLPADTINTLSAQLPVILVSARFGAEIAGQLAMALKILGAPVGLFGGAVLDVFKRHAAASFRAYGNCQKDYRRTLCVLAIVSITFSIPSIFLIEIFFDFALGSKWHDAGSIAVWLIPLFTLKFIASPLSYVVYIVNKQHTDLVWQIGLLTMTIITLYFFADYETSVKAFSTGYSFFYLVYIWICYQYSFGKNFTNKDIND